MYKQKTQQNNEVNKPNGNTTQRILNELDIEAQKKAQMEREKKIQEIEKNQGNLLFTSFILGCLSIGLLGAQLLIILSHSDDINFSESNATESSSENEFIILLEYAVKFACGALSLFALCALPCILYNYSRNKKELIRLKNEPIEIDQPKKISETEAAKENETETKISIGTNQGNENQPLLDSHTPGYGSSQLYPSL